MCFIEALTKHVVVFLDAYASTCDCTRYLSNKSILEPVDFFNNVSGGLSMWFTWASIHACNRNGCHLVTLEGGTTIFNAILAPMCDGNSLVTCESVPHITNLVDDDGPIRKVMKRSPINK